MIDFEKDVNIDIKDDALKDISELSQKLVDLEEETAMLETALKKVKENARKISEEIIPEKMNEMNLTSLSLKDGSKLEVVPAIYASIPAKYKEEAFDWLRDHGHGDLIKNQLSASFGRGEDEKAEDFKHKVSELGLPVQQKVWVEPMTLKAFVREQVTKGNEIPMDKFGVFVGSKTKLSKK